MTLRLPYAQLPETLKRLAVTEVYLLARHGKVEITAPISDGKMLFCRADGQIEDIRHELSEAKVSVFDGTWSLETPTDVEEGDDKPWPFVAAVSYVSSEATPGVWIDAYAALPTQVQVLRSLYEEFRQTGECADVSFEEFIRLASPNVVIASPAELESYVVDREGC